jgi:hypothetical protein
VVSGGTPTGGVGSPRRNPAVRSQRSLIVAGSGGGRVCGSFMVDGVLRGRAFASAASRGLLVRGWVGGAEEVGGGDDADDGVAVDDG